MGSILGRLIRWFATDRWGRAIVTVAGERAIGLFARNAAKTSTAQADAILGIPADKPEPEPIIDWPTVEEALRVRASLLRGHLAARPGDVGAAEVLGMLEVQLAQARARLAAQEKR